MDNEKALKIMGCLREGLDPRTGVEIDQDSVFQISIVTRAIYTACDALKAQIKTDLRKQRRREINIKNRPKMQGQKWLAEEDKILKEELNNNMSIPTIAIAHQQSCVAIEKRIEKFNVDSIKN